MKNKKTAIVLGATGLTGSILLNKLLTDETYTSIKVFGRRSLGSSHPKIEEFILDLQHLKSKKEDFTADVAFCCIGSTKKKTPDPETYRKVDIGIPTQAAILAKANNIKTFIVISALGANKNSSFFYNKIKGEMEENVLRQEIENTYILRPSLIAGKREEKRNFEFLWKQSMKVANSLLLGPLKKYRSISAHAIASAMLVLEEMPRKIQIIESDEIKRIAQQKNLKQL